MKMPLDLTYGVTFEAAMMQTLNITLATLIVVVLIRLLIKEQMAVGRVLA